VFVVDCGGWAVGPATAIAASVPAVKIAAARTTDSRAFFMAGTDGGLIFRHAGLLPSEAKRLEVPARRFGSTD
jgi:hypothetical protein